MKIEIIKAAPGNTNLIMPWIIMFREDINSEVWRSWWVSNKDLKG